MNNVETQMIFDKVGATQFGHQLEKFASSVIE
jgi:hypothetical protein